MPRAALAFGPYLLDERSRRLHRDGVALPMTQRHISLLHCLASNPGMPVSKDALIAAGWKMSFVTDNSVEQAMSRLRRALGPRPDGVPYIEAVPRLGYRLTVAVQRVVSRESASALRGLLLPERDFIEGRDALETLHSSQEAAEDSFRRALAVRPDDALTRAGLANACRFKYEATRIDITPDLDSLIEARRQADEACALDPECAEAWATLGTVLASQGNDEAALAVRRAIALEPSNWRHTLRLSAVSWGEARLRAAERALQQLPDLALAHWFAATVHVARQAYSSAMRHAEAGSRAQDAQTPDARFGAVGLHWLRGLLLLHAGDEAEAEKAFCAELNVPQSSHIYSREAHANSWYALGVLYLRRNAKDQSLVAFEHALALVPSHVLALAGRAIVTNTLGGVRVQALSQRFEVSLAKAAGIVSIGNHVAAAAIVRDALTQWEGASVGWIVPVEPLLRVNESPAVWADVLTTLRTRAA
ncbi:MAG: winged helix-turn-helix domain-containing protein [Vicinamibacterales bacterium]